LRERGWVEGQNIVIEYRWVEGQIERFPSLAAELVSLKPDLIVAVTSAAVRAAKQATSTIPIVMVYVFDPLGEGVVTSLARPGGNITGLTFTVDAGIVGKQLELLKELLPKVSHVAVLFDPNNSTWPTLLSETRAAAQALALKLQVSDVRSPGIYWNAPPQGDRNGSAKGLNAS
jgi:putative tryptophan/tyrosine transport system substrate-binding protein